VPGYRDGAPLASREATDANANPAGTPQCRAVRFNLMVVSGRLPLEPNAGGAPRGRGAVWAFWRTPRVQGSPERAKPGDGPPAGLGLKPSPLPQQAVGPVQASDGGGKTGLLALFGGLWRLGHCGPKPFFGRKPVRWATHGPAALQALTAC
jgi:hypothetical protein